MRRIEVPQPAANPANDPPGVGLVFVEFEELGVAKQAQVMLLGIKGSGCRVERCGVPSGWGRCVLWPREKSKLC